MPKNPFKTSLTRLGSQLRPANQLRQIYVFINYYFSNKHNKKTNCGLHKLFICYVNELIINVVLVAFSYRLLCVVSLYDYMVSCISLFGSSFSFCCPWATDRPVTQFYLAIHQLRPLVLDYRGIQSFVCTLCPNCLACVHCVPSCSSVCFLLLLTPFVFFSFYNPLCVTLVATWTFEVSVEHLQF